MRPFTPAQIKLLETFADQAVIAIENVRLFQELKESLEQQTATSEILGVIASSPTDIQPVLDAVAERAAKLCDAGDAGVWRVDGDRRYRVAHFGAIPTADAPGGGPIIDRDTPPGRAIVDRKTIHVHDLQAAEAEFPGAKTRGIALGIRTLLAIPLLHAGVAIGAILIRRQEARPFSDRQIKLLETFADQAVIAIENVRLFQELKESLDQQTATSEILGVIASSPTDVQPVLDVVAANAARLCDAKDAIIHRRDGDLLRDAAHYGPISRTADATETPLNRDSVAGRAAVDRQVVHIHDMQAESDVEFPLAKSRALRDGTRSVVGTPLMREGIPLGAILIRRTEVRPFSDKQIALLKTFADQAVIAIENVRLFREIQERNAELREALEHQTATAEVLGIISRSPTDVQPVLDAIVESAARVCGIDDVVLRLREGKAMVCAGSFWSYTDWPRRDQYAMIHSITGCASMARSMFRMSARKTIFRNGFGSSGNFAHTLCRAASPSTENVIGSLIARRIEVRPFTPTQIKLLETFADQAVIAIENVRLFKELDERTNELTRSVGELKALGEVGQTVSSTFDLETVLTRIVSHAVQLSGTDGGAIYEYDEQSEEFLLRATDHMEEELINALRANPPRLGDGVVGRAAATRQPVEVPNILEERAYAPRMRQLLERFGFRASLAVPLLREDRIVGGLVVRRKSSRRVSPRSD